MGRKIVCPECNTIFDEDILKQKNSENTCLVCGASLLGDNKASNHQKPEPPKEKKTYYYYGGRSATLTTVLFDHRKLTYTFEATDMEDAERQLRKVCPDSPLLESPPSSEIRCPYCFSTQFQLVPRKFSLLTGFATNKVDRICAKCKKRF